MNDQVTVLIQRCTMKINLDPFFTQNAINKQKKLIGYVFEEPWRNEEAIRVLGAYLHQKRTETMYEWAAASSRFQNEYTSTKFRYDITEKDKRTIDAANRKLLNAVKRHKANHDRWDKLITHYETLKKKTNTNIEK